MSVRNVLSVDRSLFITNENAILVHCTNMTKESCGKDFTNDNALKMHDRQETYNKTPKVVSVGCIGPWKHNGLLSEFGKIRETGKMCHVMSIDE